jgi:cyclohexyl-isocyanide hydratase
MTGPAIGILCFPQVTQLDLTGPYEVFSRLPGKRLELVWKDTAPVVSHTGFVLTPTCRLDDCPQFDVIVVPGGPGQQALMDDDTVLAFLRRQAAGARWVMSVCTGSLVLGAAGLIAGRRASCHWLSLPLVADLGGIPAEDRVVFDGTLCTTAGVSAGIDGALALVERLADRDTAEFIQLAIEYDPQPLFDAGSPRTAPTAMVERVRAMAAPMLAARAEGARAAARRLGLQPTGDA